MEQKSIQLATTVGKMFGVYKINFKDIVWKEKEQYRKYVHKYRAFHASRYLWKQSNLPVTATCPPVQKAEKYI